MRTGPKKMLPSEKVARGTLRPCRDGHLVEMVEPGAMPRMPDWLPPEAEEVWQDDVGRVQAKRLASESDSTFFANYCALQGGILKAVRAGDMPPIAAFAEARKMQELLGIAGARSRLRLAAEGDGAGNPFRRNGRKR